MWAVKSFWAVFPGHFVFISGTSWQFRHPQTLFFLSTPGHFWRIHVICLYVGLSLLPPTTTTASPSCARNGPRGATTPPDLLSNSPRLVSTASSPRFTYSPVSRSPDSRLSMSGSDRQNAWGRKVRRTQSCIDPRECVPSFLNVIWPTILPKRSSQRPHNGRRW